MGAIARTTKQGGTTSLQDGQTALANDVNGDMVAIFSEINGELDDANIKTAEMPGAKSFRFTETSAPGSPSANDILLYGFDVGGTTVLATKDSGGTVALATNRLGARVYNDAAISLTSNSLTPLTFNQERYDVGGFHSTSSNTGRLTAPIAGKYLIIGHVRFSTDTDYTNLGIRIIVTGGGETVANDQLQLTYASATQVFSIATVYSLAAGDYAELNAIQTNTGAGAEDVEAVGNFTPEFAIHYLGA
jgi:hypothetical protein